MDYSKIDIPKYDLNQTKPRIGALSQLDAAKIRVASRLINKSIASVLQTAVLTYLSRTWEEHEKRLTVEAKQQGKTPEELFNELSREE